MNGEYLGPCPECDNGHLVQSEDRIACFIEVSCTNINCDYNDTIIVEDEDE